MATLEEEYKQYRGAQGVNQMYDAQKQATLARLESAYNQNLSNAQAARDQIPQQYQARANDLAVQYERNRRNLNQQAAANGLNTGAGSQMQLALGSNYQRDYGGVRTAQQQAIDLADRNINDLKAAYQNSVQQAVANNDYQRLQALMAEYKNQYQQQLSQAQTLASYGNFSGYAGIPGYSQEQIDSMRSAWIASNPQLAYNTGAITAEDYYRMTGKWPAGYAPAGTNEYTPGSNGPNSWKDKVNKELADRIKAGAPTPDQNSDNWVERMGAGVYGNAMNSLANAVSGNGTGAPASNGPGNGPFIPGVAGNFSQNTKNNWDAAAVQNMTFDQALAYGIASGQITEEEAKKIKNGG